MCGILHFCALEIVLVRTTRTVSRSVVTPLHPPLSTNDKTSLNSLVLRAHLGSRRFSLAHVILLSECILGGPVLLWVLDSETNAMDVRALHSAFD